MNVTIPLGAFLVSGKFWGGWTWLTKDRATLKIVRYLDYQVLGDDQRTQVRFTREECYEQFKDDLEWEGERRAALAQRLGESLPLASVDPDRGLQPISRDPQNDH